MKTKTYILTVLGLAALWFGLVPLPAGIFGFGE